METRVLRWLYIGLLVLALLFFALWLPFRSDDWANNWLPNFVAEWSGLLLAVVAIERLQRRAERAPLRSSAGAALERALRPVVNFAASTDPQAPDEPVEAVAFVDDWAARIQETRRRRLSEWLATESKSLAVEWMEEFAGELDVTAERLCEVSTKYSLPILDAAEINNIDALASTASRCAESLRFFSHDIKDHGAEAPLGSHLVGLHNLAADLATHLKPVVVDCQAITRRTLMTPGNVLKRIIAAAEAKRGELLQIRQDADDFAAGLTKSEPEVCKRALLELSRMLEDPDAYNRKAAASALAERPSVDMTEALVSALKDQELDVRESALRALEGLGGSDQLRGLRTIVKDRVPYMRQKAIRKLAELGGDEAASLIRSALSDPDPDVRNTAKNYLKRLGSL